MATDASDIADELSAAVAEHVSSYGTAIIEEHERASELLVAWLAYLRSSATTGTADELLGGFHAAIIEVAGCLTLGLVRPAIFSLRGQVDVLCAWLFFKDHSVEWRHVEMTGQKYRLVSDVTKYLKTYFPRFEERLRLLRKNRRSGDDDPYSLLSAHVHGQNTSTIPPLVSVPELVQAEARCGECLQLQKEISEDLNDILVATYVDEWADLPDTITKAVQDRLSKPQLKELCAS